MTTITIDMTALTAHIDKMAALGAAWPNLALPAARVAGVKAEELAGEYPPPKRAPMEKSFTRQYEPRAHTWTDKQRRYFFWALRMGKIKWEPKATYRSKYKSFKHQHGFFGQLITGQIQTPYRRTGTLGKSIVSVPFALPDRVGFRIGTNRAYAPLVIGSEKEQAPYHRGHWTPLETRLRQGQGIIAETFKAQFDADLGAYMTS